MAQGDFDGALSALEQTSEEEARLKEQRDKKRTLAGGASASISPRNTTKSSLRDGAMTDAWPVAKQITMWIPI
jgi:hypothetical protein